MAKFVTCFWGTDFCSTAGAEALSKRMKDGKQMCQDLEEFVKQRADAEEKYGKSLIKLARSVEAKDEIGMSFARKQNIETSTPAEITTGRSSLPYTV